MKAEAWIADCYLQKIEGVGEFECRAAVWALEVGAVRSLLDAKFQTLGYKVLWLDGCLPARQYLTNHGGQTKIAPLARAVHPVHLVELGQIATAQSETAEPQNCLTIEEIKNIEPLDSQRGVWPEKNIPDKLLEPLFGHVDPTEEEIANYGTADAVPPMRTYAVLDSAKFQWGYSEIEHCDMPFRCLFKGNAAEDLKDAAPYLIELDPENRFTRHLFTYVPEMPDEMTTRHVWHKEPGIYIRSRAEFDFIWKHMRKFPRVQDDKGEWYFFRFWEPRVLRDYLYDVRHETGKIVNWFGKRAAALTLIAISGGAMHSYALAENISNSQQAEPIRLEQATLARQHASRVMQAFAEEQSIPFDWETYDAYEYPYENFFEEDLKILVLLHGHFGITERYPLEEMYPPEMHQDARRRSLLGRLIFFKAQGVPYGL